VRADALEHPIVERNVDAPQARCEVLALLGKKTKRDCGASAATAGEANVPHPDRRRCRCNSFAFSKDQTSALAIHGTPLRAMQ